MRVGRRSSPALAKGGFGKESCKISGGVSSLYDASRRESEFFGDGWGYLIEAKFIVAEPVDMFGLIRRQPRNDLWGDDVSLVNHVLQHPGHRHDIMKHYSIGHQVIVTDDFALLCAVVLPNHARAAEGHPLHERVPGFGDIGGGVDRSPQVFIVEEAEEEERAHDTAEFAKGHIQFVLAAVRPELPQVTVQRGSRKFVSREG